MGNLPFVVNCDSYCECINTARRFLTANEERCPCWAPAAPSRQHGSHQGLQLVV